MADFVLLYTGGTTPETDEERNRVMKAWTDWYGTIGSDLKDGGNPFGVARTVASDGSVRHSADPHHTGYTIVSAASIEAAIDVAKASPVLEDGGKVTVYEVVEAM